MSFAILANGLSKKYRIGERGDCYRTFRESIMSLLARPFRRQRQTVETESEPAGQDDSLQDLWALRDVGFRVDPGEVLGVIGPNGAGKSTLLKVLTRITSPTTGMVDLHGRVGSLLEVGTGFHPELTGRENVYLNGAILGMSRREVTRKFDAIVEFAEVERFLDTPVKRYSSGMYMRLAFAVASHLEPEILLVDEVLAVGDAAFQRKCLGRMGQVSKEGRTVLFVSHNMTAIKSLCTRAMLLNHGRIMMDGDVDEVVNHYLDDGTEMARTGHIPESASRYQDVPDEARFRSISLENGDGQSVNQFYFGQPIQARVVCDVLKVIPDGHFEISISTRDGTHVTYSTTLDGGQGPTCLTPGRYEITVELDVTLLPREYTIDLGLHHQNGTTCDMVYRTMDFQVLRVANAGSDHYLWPTTRGYVRAKSTWHQRTVDGHVDCPERAQTGGVR